MKILNPVYDKLSIVEMMSKGSEVQGSGFWVPGSKILGSKVQRFRVQG